MSIGMIVLFMALCLLMEGFFAGSEIAVVSADRLRLRHLAAKGSHGARLALEMLKKPERLLTTTLVGINIAIVTNTSLATLLAIELMGQEHAWVAIAIVAPFIWVFGEIVPKSIFQQKSDYLAPRIIYVLKGASILFFPIIALFTLLLKVISVLFGSAEKQNPFTLREEIEMVLRMKASETDIQPVEKSMIYRLFNFGETKVRDIMVPLIDVQMVERNANCGQALQIASSCSHLLLPVYEGRTDNVIGVLNTVELLGVAAQHMIRTYIHPVRYVPGAKSIEDLLSSFQKEGDTLAMVVDEYGSCEGIISLEDIMERVVGEIRDEYDVGKSKDISWWKQLDNHTWLVNPRMTLVILRDELGIILPDGNYETLGGFLLDRFQDIPQEGESIRYDEIEFTVTKARASSIREVKIVK